jgi:glycosyltransferase involved in cell wall biosynthesis
MGLQGSRGSLASVDRALPESEFMANTARSSAVPVSLVSPDLSHNCLGRTLLLAELAAQDFDVKVVGIRRKDTIWTAAHSFRLPIHDRPMRHAGEYPAVSRWLRTQLLGTRVVVCKPRATSLGLALLAGVSPGSMLLDVDDWELGFHSNPSAGRFRRLVQVLDDAATFFDPRKLGTHWGEIAFDVAAQRFPHVLVSNSWLKARFGGVVLPHVRDTDFLDPTRVDRSADLDALGMRGRSWVGFIGTLGRHKGVEDLIAALRQVTGEPAPGLFLAGVGETNEYAQQIVAKARAALGAERLRVVNEFPFSELPRWTALPDVICLPSRDEPAAWGQIPAKLFDAMAMGKPVIATGANDIGKVLSGCGVIVEARNPKQLAAAIETLLADARMRQELGAKARARAIADYSYAAARGTLRDALRQVPVFEPGSRSA